MHCTDQLFCVFKCFHIKALEKDIWTSANSKDVSWQNPKDDWTLKKSINIIFFNTDQQLIKTQFMKQRKTTGKLLFITLIKSVVRLDLAMTDQNLNYLEFFLFLLHVKDWLGSPEPSSYYHFVMFFVIFIP